VLGLGSVGLWIGLVLGLGSVGILALTSTLTEP
jgi:hypothetical protein